MLNTGIIRIQNNSDRVDGNRRKIGKIRTKSIDKIYNKSKFNSKHRVTMIWYKKKKTRTNTNTGKRLIISKEVGIL